MFSFQGFQAIDLTLCTDIISILKMCMCFFVGEKIIFDKITAFWTQTILRLGFNMK